MLANKDRVEGGRGGGGGGGGLKDNLWQTNLWMLFTPHLSFNLAMLLTVQFLSWIHKLRPEILYLASLA